MYLPVNVAPRRTMVVADPSKLTFFAQANAARFGIQRTAGALSGLGEDFVDTQTSLNKLQESLQPPAPQGDNVANNIASAVGSFARELFGWNKQPAAPPPLPPPPQQSALPTVAIVGGAVVAAVVLWKVLK